MKYLKDIFKRWMSADRQFRQSWMPRMKELSDFILPDNGYALSGATLEKMQDDAKKKDGKIINGTATRAAGVLAAGMLGGLTSPSKQWFSMYIEDPAVRENQEVSMWLHLCRNILLEIIAKSNFYSSVAEGYEELGVFANFPMLIEEDYRNVINCRGFTAGEYRLGLDASGRVSSLYIKTRMTVREIVERFGEDNLSESTARAYEDAQHHLDLVSVIQAIEPLTDKSEVPSKHHKYEFLSVFFEESEAAKEDGKVLSEKGYFDQPFAVARWTSIGRGTYGTKSPGMKARGDIKQLQKMEYKKLLMMEKSLDPPVNAPASMKSTGGIKTMPGAINWTDDLQGDESVRATYQITPDYQGITMERKEVENRINQFFYVDLFLSIISTTKRMTAQEVVERHEDKLILLGPVIEKVESEFLTKCIDRIFNIAMRVGAIPPPPDILLERGASIRIEYTGTLAQAQRLVGSSEIERFLSFVGMIMQMNPASADKVNLDEAIDEYSRMTGVPPSIINSDEMVQAMRQKREQMQMAQQMSELGNVNADTAQKMKGAVGDG